MSADCFVHVHYDTPERTPPLSTHIYAFSLSRARAPSDPCAGVLTARVYPDITKQATSDLKIYE